MLIGNARRHGIDFGLRLFGNRRHEISIGVGVGVGNRYLNVQRQAMWSRCLSTSAEHISLINVSHWTVHDWLWVSGTRRLRLDSKVSKGPFRFNI